MRRRVLRFVAAVLVLPVLAGVYLLSAKPKSNVGIEYKAVELSDIVGTPLDPSAVAAGEIPSGNLALDGKLVSIEGEMVVPPGGKLGPNEFLLIDRPTNPDGSVKTPGQYVLVRMPADKRVERIAAPLRIFGKFHAGPLRDATGQIGSIYQLDGYWILVP